MNIQKISLFYHTLKYLRPIQFQYRAYYFVRNKYRKASRFKYNLNKKGAERQVISFENSIPQHETWLSDNIFSFLNKKHDFKSDIDWNFNTFGKLWTYNLTYFEFLEQKDLKKEDGLRLICDFIQKIDTAKDALEPFPIALRLMYWTKFLTKNNICDPQIDASFRAQAYILADNLEYHILGNHLLEDGFGLLMAAYYFQDDFLYETALSILKPELDEQILADGAHFERSPMYHQHILFRVLDSIHLIQSNNFYKKDNLLDFFIKKGEIMLGWLEQMTFRNGDIPMLNDSAPEIAPSSAALFEYAERLNVTKKIVPLQASGYRKYSTDRFEMVCDVGDIAPDYIPGHAHSDTLSFVLYLDNQPFIVDRGISTYEANTLRQAERGTAAHNTVMVQQTEQSEIWGGFRVARRAKVQNVGEKVTKNGTGNIQICRAEHDGYDRFGIRHQRRFETDKKGSMTILDEVYSKNETKDHRKKYLDNWQSFLHFHPNVSGFKVKKDIFEDNYLYIDTNIGRISIFTMHTLPIKIRLESYEFCTGFNTFATATKLVIEGVPDLVFISIIPY